MKHIVCYSGGHSSALVAIEVARKYGDSNTILLNHDISASVEDADVKRFKREVSEYLNIPITYANIKGLSVESLPDQFDVCIEAKAFKVGNGSELCTNRLKTKPFQDWLKLNDPEKGNIIYYGFDMGERSRIQRRSSIMSEMGYRTDYPLALWADRTIHSTEEIGIKRPLSYSQFKHANCIGCLKAGKLHWYITYCNRPDIFEKAKAAEDAIGYTIIASDSMRELEQEFSVLKAAGVVATEHEGGIAFANRARKVISHFEAGDMFLPCECVI